MAKDWQAPAESGGWQVAPAVEAPRMDAAHTLRPLSTGEVLDRTFSVYRSHFWLFAGIATFSGAVQVLVNAFNLLGHHIILDRAGLRAATVSQSIGSLIAGLAFVLAASITQAATVHALGAVYLGNTTTVMESFRAILGRWYRWIGVALWQAWSMAWVGTLIALPGLVMLGFGTAQGGVGLKVAGGFIIFIGVIGGGVYGVIAYIRNSLGVQAAVIEESKVRPAMRRSKTLTSGTKGRIFVVLLIAGALYMVAGVIQSPLLFLMMRTPLEEHIVAQTIILLVGFVSHTLVSPVALIGLTLVYFDQRVRKEGFDILMLLGPEPVPVAYEAVSYEPVAETVFEPVVEAAPVRTDDETSL